MAETSILVVEDDADFRRLLTLNLGSEGYKLYAAGSAEEGLVLARRKRPSLFILDIGLPRMDGLELGQALRRESRAPIIFLSARGAEVDRLLGFSLGADDYLTKPFSFPELRARVKAILRRAEAKEDPALNGAVHIGGLAVDFARHEVRVNGKPQDMTPREFQLLRLLIEAKGRVLSREHLLEKVWGIEKSMDICTRTVDQHIARVRRKLARERDRIVTVTNAGYKLVFK